MVFQQRLELDVRYWRFHGASRGPYRIERGLLNSAFNQPSTGCTYARPTDQSATGEESSAGSVGTAELRDL